MKQRNRVVVVSAILSLLSLAGFLLRGTSRLSADPATPCPNACACRTLTCLAEVTNVGGMRTINYTAWYFRDTVTPLQLALPDTNAVDANSDQKCVPGAPQNGVAAINSIAVTGTVNCFVPTPPAGTTVRVEASPPDTIMYPAAGSDPPPFTQKVCK